MKLALLHGPPASGKLTVAKALAARTGFALFHNHLVVDAVAALFPFGSEPFCRLRETIWLDLLREAAIAQRDTIFTFAPEPTVSADFIARLVATIEEQGGSVVIIELRLDPVEQERRLMTVERSAFGKLRDVAVLHALRPAMAACSAAMPPAALTIDTGTSSPEESAQQIAALLD